MIYSLSMFHVTVKRYRKYSKQNYRHFPWLNSFHWLIEKKRSVIRQACVYLFLYYSVFKSELIQCNTDQIAFLIGVIPWPQRKPIPSTLRMRLSYYPVSWNSIVIIALTVFEERVLSYQNSCLFFSVAKIIPKSDSNYWLPGHLREADTLKYCLLTMHSCSFVLWKVRKGLDI